MKRRIDIDILKGILILLVVIGHQAPAPISTVIYWFHMPSFFIISGFLWKEDDISFSSFVKRKTKSLLIPYVAYCAVIVLIIERNPKDFIFDIIGGGSRYTYGVYWFIPALFITEVLYYFLYKFIRMCSYRKQVITLSVIAVGLIGLSSLYSLYFFAHLEGDYTGWSRWYQIPWSLDVCVLSLGYYIIGYLFKICSEKMKTKISILKYVGFSAFCVCILGGATGFLKYQLDMKKVLYPNFLLNLLLPICGFCFCFCIAQWISKISIANMGLACLGKESMAIMFLHGQFLVLIGKIFSPKPNPHWIITVTVATFCSFVSIKIFRYIREVISKKWK